MIKPHCSNFRVITANFLGVRIVRIFTVGPKDVNGMANSVDPDHTSGTDKVDI